MDLNEEVQFIGVPAYTFPATILPENLKIVGCHYNNLNYKDTLFQALSIPFPDTIKSSVIKRQAEYLAGRYVARAALNNLGVKVKTIPIGKNRCPIWPMGVNASISHTSTRAICVSAYKHHYQYLGLDIENQLSSEQVDEVKNSVINKNEDNLLVTSAVGYEMSFSLVFSAKESLFKALYPSVGYYFDFLAAEITDICFQTNRFSILLLQDLTKELQAGTQFSGLFFLDETSVLTLIAQ